MFQVKVLVVSFKIWGCFNNPKHLLVYNLASAIMLLSKSNQKNCKYAQFCQGIIHNKKLM